MSVPAPCTAKFAETLSERLVARHFSGVASGPVWPSTSANSSRLCGAQDAKLQLGRCQLDATDEVLIVLQNALPAMQLAGRHVQVNEAAMDKR